MGAIYFSFSKALHMESGHTTGFLPTFVLPSTALYLTLDTRTLWETECRVRGPHILSEKLVASAIQPGVVPDTARVYPRTCSLYFL